jgi:hypothetical protein
MRDGAHISDPALARRGFLASAGKPIGSQTSTPLSRQQRIDDAEDHRIGAEAERQRADGDDGETRRAQQQSGAVPEIPKEPAQVIDSEV